MLFACSEPCTLPARDSDNVSQLTAKSRSIACTFAQSLAPLQAYTLCSLTEIAGDYSFCATSAQWGKRFVIKLTYLCSLHSVTSLSSIFGSAGPGDLPGLTDDDKPRMRGPKRASKIRKLFNLTKDDDVRKYVNTYRRSFEGKDGKTHSKAPKIQRLVTPLTLQRKRRRASLNRQRHEKVGMLCAVIMLGSDRILLLGKQPENRLLDCMLSTILLPAVSFSRSSGFCPPQKRINYIISDTPTNFKHVQLHCWYMQVSAVLCRALTAFALCCPLNSRTWHLHTCKTHDVVRSERVCSNGNISMPSKQGTCLPSVATCKVVVCKYV